MVTEFKNDNGIDLSADPMALQRLKEAAEKAKIELSSAQSTEINLPFITASDAGPLHLQKNLTRSEFQKMTEDLVERTKAPFHQAIKDANMKVGDIDHVILVGGSIRMPAIQELVTELTGKEPHKGVNPDEVVASGAALQAGVLKGDVKDILLLDVTPLTLGIETKGGVSTKMIERNTTIPTRKSQIFTTDADNQPEVEINVLQGEREMAQYNKSLGRFKLTGIPPALRGTPQIEVTFDIDANGIVSVNAKDLGTGKSQAMTITGGTALSKEEIDRMNAEAEAHAEEDRARREVVEARNNADNVSYQTEKLLKEHEDLLSDEEKDEINQRLTELKAVLGNEEASAGELGEKADAVIAASQVFGQRINEAAQAQAQSEAGAGDGEVEDDEEVVDAEIVDEDE
jgi:molecular chaperone DnaK